MQTKTYFASSVPAALELARRELGDEAMLMNSKPSSPEARPYGRLEVTFAYEAKTATSIPVLPVFPQLSRTGEPVLPRSSGAAFQRLAAAAGSAVEPRRQVSEIDEIRQQISELKMAVASQRSPVVDGLIESGLGADLAGDIAAAPGLRQGAGDGLSHLMRELVDRIPVAAFPEIRSGEGRTIALVGPPGRGKTTTIIKIAMRFGLARQVPVKIYVAGSHSIGGEEQMARYASVLGVPCQSCELLESLTLALNGDQWKGLALIDTPGISPSDSIEIGEFARFFKRRTEIEKHLVLRADARSADISHVLSRFSAMEVNRLLFTGLDEVVSLGSMADAIMRSRIPASLAGTGQRIPEDLEVVSASWLARALQRGGDARESGPAKWQIESATAAVAA